MADVYWLGKEQYFHAGNVMEVHFPGVPYVKVDGFSAETLEVFEYVGCF